MPETLAAPSTAPGSRPGLRSAAIGAVASALPETVVTNAPIAERLGVDEKWIVERTGISERRVAAPEDRLSDLATVAARSTLERAGVDAADLDMVLVGTMSQDELTPNTAPLVAAALGATRAAAIDVGAACTAFLAALRLGTGQIESGHADTVLVIGSDMLSRFLDRDDKRTAALFGDGAGAVLLRAADTAAGVGPIAVHADGSKPDLIHVTRADALIRMEGHETFKNAVTRLSEVTEETLAAAELTIDDIDLFVYHQANGRILEAVGRKLALPTERVVDYVSSYGNTSAASIPIALADAEAEGRLFDGAKVLLAAFGAGFTWGGGVVTWGFDGDGEAGARNAS